MTTAQQRAEEAWEKVKPTPMTRSGHDLVEQERYGFIAGHLAAQQEAREQIGWIREAVDDAYEQRDWKAVSKLLYNPDGLLAPAGPSNPPVAEP